MEEVRDVSAEFKLAGDKFAEFSEQLRSTTQSMIAVSNVIKNDWGEEDYEYYHTVIVHYDEAMEQLSIFLNRWSEELYVLAKKYE
jgi:hypothetical protein